MKLNFEALAGPVTTPPTPKARGHAGTAGTPASMRVCAPAGVGDNAGTRGDKCAEAVEQVAFPAAPCPQVSPSCPRRTAAERVNEINVSPASPPAPGIKVDKTGGEHFTCEAFEERAAIMEFDGGLTRTDAEAAARVLAKFAH